uniref:polycomb group RING finger protein 6-like n=1 Tax=Jaculus jaculus TaxID=51337 RepID=UPI001E1AFCCA|nr:polycomb group RING finger protein 6-like [Jaculus jaculus]
MEGIPAQNVGASKMEGAGAEDVLLVPPALYPKATLVPLAGEKGQAKPSDTDTQDSLGSGPPNQKDLVKLSELMPFILCPICKGYLIDATTITECLHTFCKSCIVKHLDHSNRCPKCNTVVHPAKPHYNLRLDAQLQNIVYKLVSGLEEKEKKRRCEFYKAGQEALQVAIPQATISSPGDAENAAQSLPPVPTQVNVSLLLEFMGANEGTGYVEPLKKKFVRVCESATIAHVQKFLKRKIGLDPSCQVEIRCAGQLLKESQNLAEIQHTVGEAGMQDGLLVLYYRVVSPLKEA